MRSSPTLALCLLLAGAAQAQDLNVITGVEVKDSGTSVVVTVKGSKPPNFTTFSMADPARFVIDLSEARFQGVPEDMRVDDGVIRVVKNLAYGSGASAIARVMLAFSVEVEPPDVQTDGTSLIVKVIKPAGAAVAATGSTPSGASAGAGDAAASGAGAAAAAAAAVLARSEADEAARREALAREQREAEAREQARLAAEATAKEREAQDRAAAEARALEAQQLAAQQAAADEAARVAADARRAEIKAKAAAETAQAQQLAGESPAAAPLGAAAPIAASASVAVAVDPAAQSEAERAARAQAKADARARREVDQALAATQAAEGGTRVASEPPAAPPAATPAAPPAAPPTTAAAAAATVKSALAATAASGRPAKLQVVGFKQLPTVSRVFVKTSAPSRFTISDLGDDVVRLEVENTRAARRNDTRPLDTSFFPSAVAMITPSRQGTSYVLDIKLRKRVPYQQKVEGDVVAIDFERPPGEGSPAGEAAPAAAAAGPEVLDNAQGLIVAPEEKAEGAEPDGDPEPAPKQ